MRGFDEYKMNQPEILRLYLLGKSYKHIAGLTGVCRIRIEHELEKAVEKDPELLRRHLRNRYPSQRKAAGRWPAARLVLDPREQIKAVNEY